MQNSQWVDRYVQEVGRLVPAKKRNDIELEIRSLIEDELDALPHGDPAATEAATLEILRSFGRPSTMAARYGATQVLIGPALYPTFVVVLRIVIAVMFGLSLLGVAVAIAVDGAPVSLFDTLGNLMASIFQGAGVVVLIFAILERINGVQDAAQSAQWDPRSLPPVEVGDRIKWGEMVTEITFSILAIVFFNFYLGTLGGFWSNGEWNRIELFSDAFKAFVPWFTVLWSLQILLAVAVMLRGRWEILTRLANIALSVAGLGIIALMLAGDPLAAWPPLEPAFGVTLVVVAVFTVIDIVKDALALLNRRRGNEVNTLPPAAQGPQRKITT
jgi:hypothetical protein